MDTMNSWPDIHNDFYATVSKIQFIDDETVLVHVKLFSGYMIFVRVPRSQKEEIWEDMTVILSISSIGVRIKVPKHYDMNGEYQGRNLVIYSFQDQLGNGWDCMVDGGPQLIKDVMSQIRENIVIRDAVGSRKEMIVQNILNVVDVLPKGVPGEYDLYSEYVADEISELPSEKIYIYLKDIVVEQPFELSFHLRNVKFGGEHESRNEIDGMQLFVGEMINNHSYYVGNKSDFTGFWHYRAQNGTIIVDLQNAPNGNGDGLEVWTSADEPIGSKYIIGNPGHWMWIWVRRGSRWNENTTYEVFFEGVANARFTEKSKPG